MKKFDYIVIQAPMISELGLKGNSLLVFALIHSYTRDQKHTFRASLKEMAEWFTTSENAINSTLKALVKAGYINKLGSNNAPEYTTNFEELMAKVEVEGSLRMDRIYEEKMPRLLNQYPKQKAVEASTTESVALLNQYGKGTETVVSRTTETVVTPINKNIINNKIYSSCCWSELTEEQKQQEQEEFFKMFFFRGAADPAAEVARFVAHNQVNGWQNKSGARYDSTEKRLSIAEFWEFKTGQRECKEFLKWWREVYEKVEAEVEAKVLLDPRIKIVTSDKDNTFAVNCTKKAQEFIEKNLDKVRDTFLAKAAGKRIIYIFLK